MKALFLLLELLTDSDAVRNLLDSCFTAGVVSVVALLLMGAYRVIRLSWLRRNTATPSRA